jgi:long-chain acyl-CoA synthetase
VSTTVAARLADTAASHADRPAVVWHDQSMTWAELDTRVDRAAGGLQHLGIAPGDRVALLLGNVPAFIEAYYGTLRAGGVAVPLTLGLAADEVAHALADSGASVLVVAAVAADDVVDAAQELDVTVVVAGAQTAPPGTTRWRDLLDADHSHRPVEPDADDLAALVYTSGTTGRPRGAMLTQGNLVANQDQSLAGRFRVDADDVVMLVLPLSHIYALNVGVGACVRVGATMILQERFDPTATLESIERHRVTIMLGAPPMYVAWNNLPGMEDHDLSSLRLAVSGAAALPVPVLERFRDLTGLTIEEGYGLTEASPSVAANSMAPEPRPGTVGMPLPDIDLRLVNADGKDVDGGDPGEVWVRGPNVFAGYWNDPDATAAALVDGWLRTGDVGVLDGDGYLRLVDRTKDLIIVSGFNVYPREVERVLLRHDAVEACAVVGVPHPYTGEAVRAFVVASGEVTEDELTVWCRSMLARYKCPETVTLVDELPLTVLGKVRRVDLRGRDD